jgi:hypothetical protein
MKNQKVRADGSKKKLTAQSKSKPGPVRNPADNGARRRAGDKRPKPLRTILIQDENGNEYCRVDMPSEIYAKLQQRAKDLGWTLQRVFTEAVRAQVGNFPSEKEGAR